jgi:hypothetical protein
MRLSLDPRLKFGCGRAFRYVYLAVGEPVEGGNHVSEYRGVEARVDLRGTGEQHVLPNRSTRSTSGSPFPAAGASARPDPAAGARSSRRGQIVSRQPPGGGVAAAGPLPGGWGHAARLMPPWPDGPIEPTWQSRPERMLRRAGGLFLASCARRHRVGRSCPSDRCRRYRKSMASASAAFHDGLPVSASSPREIRAVLAGEEAGHFDREYRQAMADAAESLDLSGVLAMLERWRRVAWSTRDDPEAHRRMLDSAGRLRAGEELATVPWQQVKTRLGL